MIINKIKRILHLFIFYLILSNFTFGGNGNIGLEVLLPSKGANPDINIPSEVIRSGKSTFFNIFNVINEYLRWSIGLIAAAMILYGGFKLITAQGDKKAMKQTQRSFIGAAVGIIIAMLSYAIIKLVVNLI